jgi:hypothetical protein
MLRKRWRLCALGVLAGYVGYRLAARGLAQVRESTPPFTRQTLGSHHELVRMFATHWRHPEALAQMHSNPAISSPLTERIVDEIRVALGGARPRAGQWVYTLAGVAQRQQDEGVPSEAADVLAFARAYAVTRGHPHPDLIDRLSAQYGARTARDLTTFVRLATMGVLMGNTLDAVVMRAIGLPAPGTTLGQELRILATFFLGVVPLVPIMFLRMRINPAGSATS